MKMTEEVLAGLVSEEVRRGVLKAQIQEVQQSLASMYYQTKQLDAQAGSDELRAQKCEELGMQMDNAVKALRALQSELAKLKPEVVAAKGNGAEQLRAEA
jgi:hypothetical protein